jgi:hypothetical protein
MLQDEFAANITANVTANFTRNYLPMQEALEPRDPQSRLHLRLLALAGRACRRLAFREGEWVFPTLAVEMLAMRPCNSQTSLPVEVL